MLDNSLFTPGNENDAKMLINTLDKFIQKVKQVILSLLMLELVMVQWPQQLLMVHITAKKRNYRNRWNRPMVRSSFNNCAIFQSLLKGTYHTLVLLNRYCNQVDKIYSKIGRMHHLLHNII